LGSKGANGRVQSRQQWCCHFFERTIMPRYLIERSFPQGLAIPMNDEGRKAVAGVVAVNADSGVTWVHSYVNLDRTQTFCIYDGPSPEAIRKVADRNNQPVGRITEVKVLDPYFYLS
jgi:hypothetical protein